MSVHSDKPVYFTHWIKTDVEYGGMLDAHLSRSTIHYKRFPYTPPDPPDSEEPTTLRLEWTCPACSARVPVRTEFTPIFVSKVPPLRGNFAVRSQLAMRGLLGNGPLIFISAVMCLTGGTIFGLVFFGRAYVGALIWVVLVSLLYGYYLVMPSWRLCLLDWRPSVEMEVIDKMTVCTEIELESGSGHAIEDEDARSNVLEFQVDRPARPSVNFTKVVFG